MKIVTIMSLSMLLVNCAAFHGGQRASWTTCDPTERYVDSKLRPVHSSCGGKETSLRVARAPIQIIR